MIYRIYDVEGNTYELNGSSIPSIMQNSMRMDSDTFDFETEMVTKSYLTGSIVNREPRLQTKTFSLFLDYVMASDSAYDDYIGELLKNLQKMVLVEDTTNALKASASISSLEVTHSSGAQKRSGSITINIDLLDGFWYDVASITVEDTLTVGESTATLSLPNAGFLKTYPVITLEADSFVGEFYLSIGIYGIGINDGLFGSIGFNTLTIDCVQGKVTLLETADRSASIIANTGFFDIPIGSNNLALELVNNFTGTALDVSVEYHERKY